MNRFDDLALTWDDDPAKVQRAAAAAEALRARIPLRGSGWRALEVGSGTGLLSRALAADLGPITLVDTSEQMTVVAAQRVSEATEAHVTAATIDLLEESPGTAPFDVAYSLQALHHMADAQGMLRAIHELLDDGGWVGVIDLDHDPEGLFHRDATSDHEQADSAAHGHTAGDDHAHHGPSTDHAHDGFSPEALADLLVGAGFTQVSVDDPGFTLSKGEPPREYRLVCGVGRRAQPAGAAGPGAGAEPV